ncbi:carbon storage regulator [Aeoliella sp. ICT_H6.2]|uniref:Translational regulator CsrA n=1 Tax=Aeoliella straminimaris TaxID=2954799 RepID=A0A9X2F8L4_9BACT|nr:carbon storage regulator [Aeoliella straminimaris]MCO6044372.1 carbon storage regulator [Aeoliella straminimaris]
MLILSRKQQQSLRIGDCIMVTVLGIQRNKVRIGIDAPKEMPILRSELQKSPLAVPLQASIARAIDFIKP